MATVANPFGTDENNEQNQGQSTAQGSNPTIGSESGATTSPGSKPPTSGSSGSFQNLSKYINANKGFNADQGGLAGTVAGNINQQAQQQKQNVQGAQNVFNQQAQQNVGQFNNMDAVNQAVSDPYGFTQSNPEGTQQVINAENAAYTGPKGFQDLQGQHSLANLSTQNSNLGNLASQTQSQGGQYNLLRQMFGKPTYNTGQQNLDQLIMNSAPGAQRQFAQARQNASGATQQLGSAQGVAQNQAQQNQQLASQVKSDTRNALNNAVSGINTNINQAVTDANTKATQDLQRLQGHLQSGQLSNEDKALLQTNPNAAALLNSPYLYGTNQALASNLTTAAGPSTQQAASQSQYNNLAALNQLMGGGAVANEQASQILQNFNDPSKAETYQQVLGGGTDLANILASGKANVLGNVNNALQYISPHATTANRQDVQRQLQNIYSNIGSGQDVTGNVNSLIAHLQNPNSARTDIQPFIDPLMGYLSNLNTMIGPRVS